MSFTRKEVREAILGNDTDRVAEILEEFELLKDGTPPSFTSGDKDLVSEMLNFASIAAWHEKLSEELAEELIERTAMTVDIFSFLRLVVAGAEILDGGFDDIPQNIRKALCRNDYTDKIARAIDNLDDKTFRTLLAYLGTGAIEIIHVKFNLPIIRRIYNDKTIPADLMFAFMSSNLRDTIDERFDGVLGIIGDLGMLGALLDDRKD